MIAAASVRISLPSRSRVVPRSSTKAEEDAVARSLRMGILAIGSLFVLTGPARALEILADDRFVHSYTDGTTLEPDYLAPFFASVPGASQSSSISQSADGLGFDGFASAFATSFLQQDPPALIG
jgi:hypothetical protein